MFKRILKLFEPKTTSLEKYKILFTTKDGVEHEFNKLNYIDPNTISCSVDDYFLIGEKYLRDDDMCLYPIKNIQKINFVLVSTIERVIEKYKDPGIRYIWYPKDIIEIYSKET